MFIISYWDSFSSISLNFLFYVPGLVIGYDKLYFPIILSGSHYNLYSSLKILKWRKGWPEYHDLECHTALGGSLCSNFESTVHFLTSSISAEFTFLINVRSYAVMLHELFPAILPVWGEATTMEEETPLNPYDLFELAKIWCWLQDSAGWTYALQLVFWLQNHNKNY